MKAYKLTDKDRKTKNETQWGVGVSHTARGKGKKLCTNGWIHFYTNPLIAALMNSAHAGFSSPILWECKTSGKHLHEPLKSGCKTLTTIKKIPLPKFTATRRIVFGILCAKEVNTTPSWNKWADDWLNGVDRSVDSAFNAAFAVAYSDAAYAIAYAATYDEYIAIATAAANTAITAASRNKTIDFVAIAKKAMTYK